MIFPIADDNSDRKIFPFVNIAFIVINILVFVLLQQIGSNQVFDYSFSLVPREITSGVDLVGMQDVKSASGQILGEIPHYQNPISVYFTFLSSMFMHGDIMHIFGNMLFLWIFGDNLENRLGHLRYVFFYLTVGFLAAIAQIVMDTSSVIPMLGASGAISGVMGGYILLYPHRRVTALLFNFMTQVPAYIALGAWFVLQFVQSFLSGGQGGVAYAAHIGGFIAGVLLIHVFAFGRKE